MQKSYFTHTLHTISLCLAPRLFSVEKKDGRGKEPLIAPIVAVSEETCVGDSSRRGNDDNERDGNHDSNDDPSARIIMAYLLSR